MELVFFPYLLSDFVNESFEVAHSGLSAVVLYNELLCVLGDLELVQPM